MKKVRIKPFLRIYVRAGEDHIFIGLGPDKVRILDPTSAMREFILQLDDFVPVDDLMEDFPEARDWLVALRRSGVLETSEHGSDTDVVDRWDRQINYLRLYDRDDWTGFEGQAKVRAARVVVVGTGSGGTTLLRLLNAAGVGHIEAADFDVFQETNLATHMMLDEADVGVAKIDSIRTNLLRQNSSLDFVGHNCRIRSASDLVELVSGADFFLHSFDRPRDQAVRWANEACLRTGVPMTSIGATDKGARVGPTVVPGLTPCLNCIGITPFTVLRPEKATALTASTVAMMTGIAINEVISMLAGAKRSRTMGESLYINTDTLDFTFEKYAFRDDCECRRRAAASDRLLVPAG